MIQERKRNPRIARMARMCQRAATCPPKPLRRHSYGASATRRRRSASERATSAFTLVELLVVILILSIIVALVVSFGPRVIGEAGGQTTRATQAMIIEAIDAYYDSEGEYPEEATPPYGPARPPFESVNAQYARSRHLYEQLVSVKASRELIAKLPDDAIGDFGDGPVFLDGFGWVMDYSDDQGFGGRPLITSAGIDNDFDSGEDAEKDNIYSDGR